MTAFIDTHRGRLGVEPICRVLGVSASAYYQRATGQPSARTAWDAWLTGRIVQLYESNYCAYGYRRMWKALSREGLVVGRDHVKRLMRTAQIQGAKRRGKPWRTTVGDPRAPRPSDLVERDFTATRPDELWVADFTYLRCWEGVVFFSFVIDVYSRRIVGWQFASHMRTTLVLDALRMALTRRQAGADLKLVHHSDAGSQGGFNWSLQHLDQEVVDGQASWMDEGVDGTLTNEVAGGALASPGGRARVLEEGRDGDHQRGGRRRCRCLASGREPLVPPWWRDASNGSGLGIGPLLVVCRA